MFGKDKSLEENGTRASAEVVKAEQSEVGITTGNPAFAGATEVVWKLDVKVKPEGAEPFEAHVEARLSQYTLLRVGTTVPVLFDPGDHSKVALDMSPQGWTDAAIASATAANPAMAGPIKEMMEAAMKDPAGFQKHAMEQAEEAFKAAGFKMTGMSPGAAGAGGSVEMVDTLERLADLRDRGVLSDEEFAKQKQKLLDES